jgi:cytochrome c biogenesis protein CcmG/thiol:disulfide interchange protein DsbE
MKLSTSRRRKPSEAKSQKGRGKRSLLFLIPLVIGIAIFGYVVTQPAKPPSLAAGDTAPDFQLGVVGANGLTGETARLSSFRGKVVFLEFMESWCSNCRWVAPAVETIREDYEAKGVVFISVAGTLRGANATSTAAFIREYGTHWTYVLDSDNSVFLKYGVEATPTFFIIDKNGVIVATYKGITTSEVFTSALDAALAG